MDFEEIPSGRGKVYLIDGFTLRKHEVEQNGILVKCSKYREKSPVRGRIIDGKFAYLAGHASNFHNHPPPSILKKKLQAAVHSDGSKEDKLHLAPCRIAENAREKLLEEASIGSEFRRHEALVELPSMAALMKSARRAKKSAWKDPIEPQTLADIDMDGFANQLRTNKNDTFLVADSGRHDPDQILVFAMKRTLKVLAIAKRIHIDGTFYACPKPFYQLVTIHALFKEQFFPCVFTLVPKKRAKDYQKIFFLVINVLRAQNLNVPDGPDVTFLTDYELALQGAIVLYFPNSKIIGCFFHFATCIWRRVKENGHAKLYEENCCFRKHVRMLVAMGFVPRDYKRLVFERAKPYLLEIPEMEPLVTSYFIPQWLDKTPHHLWTWHGVGIRTNNAVEGWHSGLNRAVLTAHPCIWNFFRLLVQYGNNIQTNIDDRALGRQPPPVNQEYANLNRRILELCSQYYQYDPLEFLKDMAKCTPSLSTIPSTILEEAS